MLFVYSKKKKIPHAIAGKYTYRIEKFENHLITLLSVKLPTPLSVKFPTPASFFFLFLHRKKNLL